MQASGFFDACVEIGQGAGLLEGDWGSGGDGGEFGEETGEGGGVGEEAVDCGAEEDGGRVAAGGYVGCCPRGESSGGWGFVSF